MNIVLVESLQQVVADIIRFAPKLLVALMTFVAALLLARPLTRAVKRTAAKRIDNMQVVSLLSNLVRWTVIGLGLLVALDQVDFDITGFVAGLGVAGITVGFALQDIARNFVAGVLLFVRRPFKVGDAVKIGGFSGSVLEIAARDTVLRTWDGETVIISNSSILDNAITNYSAHAMRRRTVTIGLGYGQDPHEAMALFTETLAKVPGVQQKPAPTVYAEAMDDSALRLGATFWIDTTQVNLLQVHSDAVVALDQAAAGAGIDLPYPIQTVLVKHP